MEVISSGDVFCPRVFMEVPSTGDVFYSRVYMFYIFHVYVYVL